MELGQRYTSITTVDADNTAKKMGSGDIDVFSTPAMIALMENAAMKAVEQSLEDGETTVGAKISITHIKPSKIGQEIKATAILSQIDGRKLTFSVVATEYDILIGEGTHVRYIVNKEKFMGKI